MALTNDLIFKAWCLLLRKCSNWTQEDLAGEACLSISTIQRVEGSTIEGFSDDTKRKYAKAYGYGDEHFLIGSPFYDELRYFLRQVSQPHICGFCLDRKRQHELHPYVVEFLERSLPEGLLETIPDKLLLNYWKSFARQLDLSNETIQKYMGKSISLSELNAHIQKFWPFP